MHASPAFPLYATVKPIDSQLHSRMHLLAALPQVNALGRRLCPCLSSRHVPASTITTPSSEAAHRIDPHLAHTPNFFLAADASFYHPHGTMYTISPWVACCQHVLPPFLSAPQRHAVFLLFCRRPLLHQDLL
jgi:hypothetical protein